MAQVTTFNPFTGTFDFTNNGLPVVSTKASILARSTDAAGTLAYSTDTYEFYVYTGSSWYKVPFALVPQSANPDMGYFQDSSPIGIFVPIGDFFGYISGYEFVNGRIGFDGYTGDGGLRFRSGYLQVYANSTWNNVVIGFTFQELSGYGCALTHQPTSFSFPIEVMSGNSITNLGLNGLPITQGYIADMGVYPGYQSVGGRTIS